MFMILCGGKGQRLWPLSRTTHPKQLISINSHQTLLESTVQRLKPLKKTNDQIGIVTTSEYAQAIKQLVGSSVDSYVIEKTGKNTAPALLLSCLQIEDEQLQDPVVVFVPSDHYIKEPEFFEKTMRNIITYAENYGDICLVGVKPEYPSTGYGYIITHEKQEFNVPANIQKFIEKPPFEIAKRLSENPHTLWNCGIFVARNSIFLQAFKQAAPELYADMLLVKEGEKEYSSIKSSAFDTTITEKISNRAVFSSAITWKDLGDLESFITYNQLDYQEAQTHHISLNGENNIALSSKKLVAFLGISDLCLIETNDVILIKKRGESDEIRNLISSLEKKGFEDFI